MKPGMLHSVFLSGAEICAAVLLKVFKTVKFKQKRSGVATVSCLSQGEYCKN